MELRAIVVVASSTFDGDDSGVFDLCLSSFTVFSRRLSFCAECMLRLIFTCSVVHK